MMQCQSRKFLFPLLLGAITASGLAGDQPPPAPASRPADNLDYWLSQAQGPASRPATQPGGEGDRPDTRPAPDAPDALPGVVELSDGRVLPGTLTTTHGEPFNVFDESAARWRRVPFEAVLSITAVVVEEKLELRWRWKAMGEPERVYTGQRYPTRLLRWRLRLVDGSVIEGPVKGQPVRLAGLDGKGELLVLHERQSGADGQAIKDLTYAKRIIVSRRLMEAVTADLRRANGPR